MSAKYPQRPARLTEGDLRLLLRPSCQRCGTPVTNAQTYRVQASLARISALARVYAECGTTLCWNCHCRGLYRLRQAVVGHDVHHDAEAA